jgi:hypothetical protein
MNANMPATISTAATIIAPIVRYSTVESVRQVAMTFIGPFTRTLVDWLGDWMSPCQPLKIMLMPYCVLTGVVTDIWAVLPALYQPDPDVTPWSD